jgi:hypothetical protein
MYYVLFTKRRYNKYPTFTAWTDSKKLIKQAYRYRKNIGIDCHIAVIKNQDAIFNLNNMLKNICIMYGFNLIETESSYSIFTDLFQETMLPSILDSLYTLGSGLDYLRNDNLKNNIDLMRWSILDSLDNGPSFIGDKTIFIDIYKLNMPKLYNEYLRGDWS